MTRDELTALSLPRELSDRILRDIEKRDDSDAELEATTGRRPKPRKRYTLNGGESIWSEPEPASK